MSFPGGTLKRYDGANWVGPAKLKYWDGAAWQHKPLFRWDGANWLEVDTGRTVAADAIGTFEIAGTVSLIDHVEASGSFDITGTVTVA